METWDRPVVPRLPGIGSIPQLYDARHRRSVALEPGSPATLYVCGITPYDATHLGHAFTYLSFDTLVRAWTDAGLAISYAQNVTDVDDPLLARALAIGVDWRVLAASQVDLFRSDMRALGIIPPDHFVAVSDVVPAIALAVERLVELGVGYRVENDVYFDIGLAANDVWSLGDVSGLDRLVMRSLSEERGGDPDRPGKHDVLDPLLWRAERPGEPSWPSKLGAGRPGWHIECAVIAHDTVGVPLTVNGGGSDLMFPHHEFSAGHTAALSQRPLAALHVHSGLVAFEGETMSKSRGNLVRVSELTEAGADPQAIRLSLLDHHYRSDWEWTGGQLDTAVERIATWSNAGDGHGSSLVDELRSAIARDLDTPGAIEAIDAHVAEGRGISTVERLAIHALLGVRL